MNITKKNKFLIVILLFILAIICKYFQYTFLSSKYFPDAVYILKLMAYNVEIRGTAFWVTAEFFKLINIFGLTTIQAWSIFFTVIFTILFSIILYKKKNEYSFSELIFIIASFALLNIFVFNLSKDIIQLIIFLIIYYFISNQKISVNHKIVSISLILTLESIFFRPYYFIVLFGFVLSFFFLDKYVKKTKNGNLITFITKILLFFFVILLISSRVFPVQYAKLIDARDIVTNILSARTEIENLVPNSYIINYIINSVRILFPVELLFKGIYYVPFVIYQLGITLLYFKSVKNINKDNILLVCILTGFYLGAFSFEPDFGSVVRHESVLFMFYLDLLIINRKRKIKNEK